MFEKSLYDLIRGLRNHRGREAEYIHDSIKECRAEIRSQDMDKKATALLKLVYLEMYGHDMSWASFHVLEVMSSQKYPQKRVGYLAAAQALRSDTDVLMLATNLLKKDLASPMVPVLSLPLLALPHVIGGGVAAAGQLEGGSEAASESESGVEVGVGAMAGSGGRQHMLALALLPDLLARMAHSNPAVRKKTVVNLYRASLVYPEAFRLVWPKIQERLMDPDEDGSVTAAIINVVCELGWRRPHDFLPLAPRLFELLVEGGNNWMAIKIIKLFATLTPLEPRLVKKLLRPLINLIQTTTAMSLLYECVNGIIQGGILDGVEGGKEGEEVASLCVNKLRGMIVLEGDPNLKYVALLAFNRIARSHPALVAEQQDVILDCLDDEDFSIRAQALDLAAVVVSSDTLEHVVNHLVAQLRESTSPAAAGSAAHGDPAPTGNGGGDAAQKVVLPGYYREKVLERVLDMCSRETYAHVTDFEWYIDVLVQLVKFVPSTRGNDAGGGDTSGGGGGGGGGSGDDDDIATRIGHELLNVAVRVQAVRAEATQAAESLLLVDNRAILFPAHSAAAANVLAHVAFVVGEYAEHLAAPERTLTSLTHPSNHRLPAPVLASFLQAIPKVFVALTVRPQEHQLLKPEEREEEEDDEPSQRHGAWDSVRRGELLLALGRIVSFLEPLAANPDFDVQERAVEFLEMLRLTGEAISAQHAHEVEMPLLVSSILPGLFDGLSLRPVAPAAQAKVPVPEGLDLDAPVNPDLARVLQDAEREWAATTVDEPAAAELYDYYYVPERGRERAGMAGRHAAAATAVEEQRQEAEYPALIDSEETRARRARERAERARDDPFYIAPDAGGGGEAGGGSGRLTPFGQVLRGAADQTGLDIDSIPMMPVEIDSSMLRGSRGGGDKLRKKKRKPRIIDIMGDETIEVEGDSTTTTTTTTTTAATTPASQARARRAQAQAQAQSSPAVARVQGRPHPPSQPSLLQFDAGSAAEQRYHDLSSSASMSMPMPSSLSPLSGHQQSGTMAGTDLSIDIAAVERSAEAEEQMAQALADLQRKRLEMQRERERVPLSAEVPEEGILVEPVKKKKKKKKKVVKESDAGSDGATTKMKKKKHKRKEAKEEEGKITGASSSLVEEKPREEAAAQGQDNEAPAPDRPAGTEPS